MRIKPAGIPAFLLTFFLVFLFSGPAGAQSAPLSIPQPIPLSSADAFLLAETLAERCPDAPYAARVAMAAAVLGRMESPAYPDSLPDVLAQLEAEGSFGGEGPDLSGRTRASAVLRGILDRLAAGFAVPSGFAVSADRIRELSSDAVRAAIGGADPARGALFFRYVPTPRTGDFRFDDSREDGFRRRMEKELAGYPLVIGTVGFR
jgi:hypothetical protein